MNETSSVNSSSSSSTRPHHHFWSNSSPPSAGLTFVTHSNDIERPINVVESAAAFMSSRPSATSSATTTTSAVSESKRDPGGLGFLDDDVGGSVDGLMSCTESLGSESSNERRVDEKIENEQLMKTSSASSRVMNKSRDVRNREKKRFPPPLSSLNHDGKPNFFLRSVRKDGRLELAEVKIHRPEILRASRQDGRLRLNFICDEEEIINEAEEEEEEEIQESGDEHDHQVVERKRIDDHGMKQAADDEEGPWRFPATSGSSTGEGFRRCHELVASHHGRHHIHHHGLHVWRPHCVTIR